MNYFFRIVILILEWMENVIEAKKETFSIEIQMSIHIKVMNDDGNNSMYNWKERKSQKVVAYLDRLKRNRLLYIEAFTS